MKRHQFNYIAPNQVGSQFGANSQPRAIGRAMQLRQGPRARVMFKRPLGRTWAPWRRDYISRRQGRRSGYRRPLRGFAGGFGRRGFRRPTNGTLSGPRRRDATGSPRGVRIGMLARRQSWDLPHCSIEKVTQTPARQVADLVGKHGALPHVPAPVANFTLHPLGERFQARAAFETSKLSSSI